MNYTTLQRQLKEVTEERDALRVELAKLNDARGECAGAVMELTAEEDPLHSAASQIAVTISNRPGMAAKAFDPKTIVTIANAIAAIFGNCPARNEPAELIERARRAGFRDRLLTNRRVRQSMSRRDWEAIGPDVVDGVFEVAANQTSNSMARIISSIDRDEE